MNFNRIFWDFIVKIIGYIDKNKYELHIFLVKYVLIMDKFYEKIKW